MQVYGNLINRIMETAKTQEPKVGDGCTITMFSDRHAATIVEIKGKRIAVQEDIAKRIDKNGMSESQDYECSVDKTAPIRWFSLRKNGRYVEVTGCCGLVVGRRMSYHDYSF